MENIVAANFLTTSVDIKMYQFKSSRHFNLEFGLTVF
jgi:hypothetical protein